MSARALEDEMLQVCVQVALGHMTVLQNKDQANAVHLLSSLLGGQQNLDLVSQKYFVHHPEDKKEWQELLGEPWMLGLSRFKNMFSQQLLFQRESQQLLSQNQ